MRCEIRRIFFPGSQFPAFEIEHGMRLMPILAKCVCNIVLMGEDVRNYMRPHSYMMLTSSFFLFFCLGWFCPLPLSSSLLPYSLLNIITQISCTPCDNRCRLLYLKSGVTTVPIFRLLPQLLQQLMLHELSHNTSAVFRTLLSRHCTFFPFYAHYYIFGTPNFLI